MPIDVCYDTPLCNIFRTKSSSLHAKWTKVDLQQELSQWLSPLKRITDRQMPMCVPNETVKQPVVQAAFVPRALHRLLN